MNTIILFCAADLIFIAAAYALVHIYFKHERKHHIRHIITIFGSAVLAFGMGHFLKDAIHHARPTGVTTLLIPDDPYSFPSGHATFMFALAFAMYTLDKRAGYILFVLAILTGIGRVLAGVHYWYDIVGGAILGYFVAWVITYASKRLIRRM